MITVEFNILFLFLVNLPYNYLTALGFLSAIKLQNVS